MIDNISAYDEILNNNRLIDDQSKKRNREHAKKTRMRKKEHIESMKSKLLELQCEVCLLIISFNTTEVCLI